MAASDMRNRRHVQLLLTWSTNAAHPVSLDRSPYRVLSAGPAEPRFFSELVTAPPPPFSSRLGTGGVPSFYSYCMLFTYRCVSGSILVVCVITGGEGALLAAAGSVIGIGNDIGGSIRIPAFINGVFGHKPTAGSLVDMASARLLKDVITSKTKTDVFLNVVPCVMAGVLSNRGQFPEPTGQLEHYLTAGPMCRYAEDLELVLRCLAGSQWSAKLGLDLPVSLADLKVFYMEGDGGNPCVSPLHPDVRSGLLKVLKYFEVKVGVRPEPVDLDLRHAAQIWGHKMLAGTKTDCASVLGGSGTYHAGWELARWIVGKSNHTFPAVGAGVVEAIEKRRIKKREYLFKKYDRLERQFQDMLKENCIFLFPTLPEPAPYHNRPLFQMHNCNFLGLFNVLGLPVTQCPVGLSGEGLPVGVQVVAGKLQDRLTLAVARRLEEEFGGWIDPSAP
ncbi:FAAH2, partial [Cordylochernes scorpioides]